MPIRRPRSPKPALRHIPFLTMMADSVEGDSDNLSAHAALLVLRTLDQWVALGVDLANPEATSHRSAREAVNRLSGDPAMRSALGTILDAIVALREPDAQPVLPRVYALASLFEQRGSIAQAGDAYSTVARYIDAATHLDLAFDAHMRHAYCLRLVGEFEWADQAYATAGMLATRDRDRARVILSRLGRAKVTWDRGNLPGADEEIVELLQEADVIQSASVKSLLLHDRAALSWMRGERETATRLVFEAFSISQDDYDRERMLSDLAHFLSQQGAVGAASTALRVLEVSARSQGVRWSAMINLMDLAYQSGDELTFSQYRRSLAESQLPPVTLANFLLDVGKGLTAFGHFSEARSTLTECARLADQHQLNRRSFLVDEALKALDSAEQVQVPVGSTSRPELRDAPEDIAAALEQLLREVAVVGA